MVKNRTTEHIPIIYPSPSAPLSISTIYKPHSTHTHTHTRIPQCGHPWFPDCSTICPRLQMDRELFWTQRGMLWLMGHWQMHSPLVPVLISGNQQADTRWPEWLGPSPQLPLSSEPPRTHPGLVSLDERMNQPSSE